MPQQAGLIDRIFNSTISWPQQMLWRLIRIAKEGDVNLLDERGLLDFANVPLLGVFDDHKEDVMPDYMAKTLGFSPGFGGELGAAIATDPLTYLTGGLSTIGRAAKGTARALEQTDLLKRLQALPHLGHGEGLATSISNGSLDDFLQHLSQGKAAMRGSPGVATLEAAEDALRALPDTERSSMLVHELLSSSKKRQLALGIPLLSALGAKITIPSEHATWWRLFRSYTRRAHHGLGLAAATRSIAAIPGVGATLAGATTIGSSFIHGYKLGPEARTALRGGGQLDPADAELVQHWLNPNTGGGSIIAKLSDSASGFEGAKEEVLKRFSLALERSPTSTADALVSAFKGIASPEDSAKQLWARLVGVDISKADGLVLPNRASDMYPMLKRALENGGKSQAKAAGLMVTGIYDTALQRTKVGRQHDILRDKRNALRFGTSLANTLYESGVRLRAFKNTVFTSGVATEHMKEFMQQLLSETTRGYDQVNSLGHSLYTALQEAATKAKLPPEDISNFLSSMMEGTFLPEEMAAALSAAKINPSNAQKVVKSFDNWLGRYDSVLRTTRNVLKVQGSGDSRIAGIADLLKTEIDGLPALGERELVRRYKSTLKKHEFEEIHWSPAELVRMERPWNYHTLVGGKRKGQQLGRLSDDELARAISEAESQGMRPMSWADVSDYIDASPKLTSLRDRHKLTNAELVAMLRPKKVGAPVKFWERGQKRWVKARALKVLEPYGIGFEISAAGGLQPTFLNTTLATAVRHYGWKRQSFDSVSDFMTTVHKWLAENPKWVERKGPSMSGFSKALEHSDLLVSRLGKSTVREIKAGLSTVELKTLRGRGERFDVTQLPDLGEAIPEGAYSFMDYERMAELTTRRRLSRVSGLAEGAKEFEAQLIPKITKRTLAVSGERGVAASDPITLKILKDAAGEALPQTAGGNATTLALSRAYASAHMNLKELRKFFGMQGGAAYERVPYELIDQVASDMTVLSNRLQEIALEQMPKGIQDIFANLRRINRGVFEQSKRAGVWIPGSPIGYLGRFFNGATRQKISEIIGEMSTSDSADILQRLTDKHPERFARELDHMTIDDINELMTELRKNRAVQHMNTSKFYNEMEQVLAEEGYRIKGRGKTAPWTTDRVERDPILATLTRLGHANQENSLENFYKRFLAGSKEGEHASLAVGGRVVALLEDSGKEWKHSRRTTRLSETKGEQTLKQIPEESPIGQARPSWVVLETSEGKRLHVPFAEGDETGFGFLDLGRADDGAVKGYTPSVAKSFVRASVRSDLHEKLKSGKALLRSENLEELVGHHVVYGADNIVTSALKTTADTLHITPAWLRTFDSINYTIKSFQTIFRLPFQLYNLSSGVFQTMLAGASPQNTLAGALDAYRVMSNHPAHHAGLDVIYDAVGLAPTKSAGKRVLPSGELMDTARRNGGDVLKPIPEAELRELGLDTVEDLLIDLGGGRRVAVNEVLRKAGQGQLFGTFASALTRGSRTIPDSLMRIKFESLDPTLLPTRMQGLRNLTDKMRGLAEIGEGFNRLSSTFALIREGHSIDNAILISRSAHVPYERLTPIERNYMKRAFLYYTFPRHYVPWAWTRFLEDPARLAEMANLIKDKNMMSTTEGKATMVLGDYRIDAGRLNANMEAALMVASFADNFAMPLGRLVGMGAPDAYPTNPAALQKQFSDFGLTSWGGIAGSVLGSGSLLPQGTRAQRHSSNAWEESRRMIWPLKLGLTFARQLGATEVGLPTKEEQNPYVDYTPMERWIADSDFGLGIRKVREGHEFRRAYYEYRGVVRQLQMRYAATKDVDDKKRYKANLERLTNVLKNMHYEMELRGRN